MQFRFRHFQISLTVQSLAALEAEVRARLTAGRGFALATMNVDHLVKLSRQPDFAAAYQAHDLVVADGNPVVWVAGLAGQKVELITGSDQTIPIIRWAAESGAPVALVGSTAEVLDRAADKLRTEIPSVEIACKIAPPFGFDPKGDEATQILEQINAAGARLCILALGAPKQEIFAAKGYQAYPHIGFASFGAGLDFIAGHQKRAPRWVRRIALEWLWRMLSNPRRMAKRYWDCALVLPGHAASALSQKYNNKTPQ